jgi:hypothetical protein
MKNQVSENVLIRIEATMTLDLSIATKELHSTIDNALKLCKTDEELKQFLKDNGSERHLEWIKDSASKIELLLELIK